MEVLQQRPYKIILSGGGTGGHIFPAIAIADALKARLKEADVLFVGARGRMEMEKVPAAGYPIIALWISGLQRRLTWKNLLFPVKVLASLYKARTILRTFRPDIVIGTGGYASGPMLRVAAARKIPTLIQEQNSFPGITNKMLAGKVDRICVAFEGMERFFPSEKLVLTGNPVRADLLSAVSRKQEGLSFFGLQGEKKILFAVGGSLGARAINDGLKKVLPVLADQGIQLIWQTGKTQYTEIKALAAPYEEQGIRVFDFIRRMDLAYAAADLVVSRAGAIAISELSVTGKPCILVPSPYVAEDHQTKNALALSDKGAAILLREKDMDDAFGRLILDLIYDEKALSDLSSEISAMAKPSAAEAIALEAINLLNKRDS